MSLVDAETGEIVRVTLEHCERVIEQGLDTFAEVGNALLTIRDERLYKQAGFKTFEAYCDERWALSKSTANRYVEAAQVAAILTPTGVIPLNEYQGRPLARLKASPEAVIEAWAEANAAAEREGKPVSHSIVEKVVAEKTGPVRPTAAPRAFTRATNRVAANVVANLVAIADSIASLDVAEYGATREEIEGLDRTIKALRKLRNALVVEE